jgi:hypothetical protein
MSTRTPFLICGLFLLPFILLATANSAGYRYGASDLAFYGPAVMRALDPQLFPRDAAVIDAQARLTFMDDTVARIARLTTARLTVLFLALYVVTLALLSLGAAAVAAPLYRNGWAMATLLAALTLRHAIARSGTNTLEGYFQPRQLAFALGLLAVAAFLRGRPIAMAAGLGAAALLHPTTTLWIAIWLAVALVVTDRRYRLPIIAMAAAAAVAGAWALSIGPLAGRLVTMDAEWLEAIAEKEYLFPLRWPLSAWFLNLGYVPVVWFIFRRRLAAGVAHPHEKGLTYGCLTLVVVFLVAAAFNHARLALAIQLQPARIFWMLDFLALVYLVWLAADSASTSPPWRARVAFLVVVALSVARGLYVMRVEFPARPLFEVSVPGDWGAVANWAQATPRGTGWLAHPNHASKYGTSFRMAAGRDVFVEPVKDAAIGMYDRSIALRTRDRRHLLEDFDQLSSERARQIGRISDLDYLVTESPTALPLVFQSGALRIYSLR